MQRINRHFLRRHRAVIAALLTGIVLLINALVASPGLHELFHPDAGLARHQCAVTMFTHGQVDSANVDVPATVPLPFIQTISPVQVSLFSPAIENLPAGRAPPVPSSIS